MSEMAQWVKAFAVQAGQPEFHTLPPPTHVKVELMSELHAHTISHGSCAHTSCTHTIIQL